MCRPFLDFRSIASRAFFCREEVRLNARLAPGVYLGVLALLWCDGQFALLPEAALPADQPPEVGAVVDWLVQMRRLPAQRLLSALMRGQQVPPAAIDRLVQVLGRFYRQAAVIDLSAQDYVNRFAVQQCANRELLLRPRFDLREAALALALDRLDRWGRALAPVLGERANSGRVLEGHGDLRPDHICLLPRPLVIDCPKFNAQLRQLAPYHELALLELECAMAATPWIGERLLTGMHTQLGEQPPRALQGFYLAHQALLRARMAASHLLDPEPRTPEKWLPLAQTFIARAQAEMRLWC